MQSIEKIVTGTANALAVAGLSVLLILATFTLFDGLLRALANYPLDIVREIGDLVAANCGACCLPITLLHGNNIALRAFEKILPAKGVELLGTFPAEGQSYIVMVAGVGSSARASSAAIELIKFLTGPVALPVIKKRGMERG